MTVKTTTGMVVSVSAAAPATYDQVGFEALTFTTVGEVTSVGEYGGSANEVEHTPLATGEIEVYKGVINNGSPSFEFANDGSDAGQILLQAGFNGAAKFTLHSFKVAYSDGEIDYFTSYVFSFTKNPGGSDSIVAGNCALRAQKAPITVAP